MIAMQYEITLPADYDMGIIHRRVETRGHLTDGFAGLGLKAYLVRERGHAGSPVNQYAPFYLWRDADGMRRFLCGDGFDGVCASFGRPRATHGIGVAFVRGPDRDETPRFASRALSALDGGVPPRGLVDEKRSELLARQRAPGLYAAALALDPDSWTLTEFALWTREPPASGAQDTYLVLHLSTPEADRLAVP